MKDTGLGTLIVIHSKGRPDAAFPAYRPAWGFGRTTGAGVSVADQLVLGPAPVASAGTDCRVDEEIDKGPATNMDEKVYPYG